MLARFLIYGFLGWILEVCFTGFTSLVLHRDRAATATTYLWMHPIYGATALGLEWLSDHLRVLPWLGRAAVYVAVIYAVEFATGWILRRALGRCPWDYGARSLSVKGLIRLDYAPAWYVAGLLFEPVRAALALALKAVAVGQVLVAIGIRAG